MDYETCHNILGISQGATLRQIHAAYKHLALRHHPDRAPDDPASHQVFIRVTEAYSILKNAYYEARSANGKTAARRVRPCPKCGRFGELLKSLDGGRYCVECLLNRRRKFLPLPVIIVIRCIGVISLLTVAVLLVMQALSTGDRRFYFLSGLASLAATIVLGYHVFSADIIKR